MNSFFVDNGRSHGFLLVPKILNSGGVPGDIEAHKLRKPKFQKYLEPLKNLGLTGMCA